MARLTARVLGGALVERVSPGCRPMITGVPPSAEALTTEWLTNALCTDVPGARVVDFRITRGSDGTSSRRALQVTYNDAGRAAGLAEALFVKSSATVFQRLLLGATGAAAGEARFFTDMRPEVDIRSPRAHWAGFDERSGRSFVVMDDVSAQGWRFPDPFTELFDEHDACDMVDQIATYHAAFWNGGRAAAALACLPTPLEFQERLNRAIPYHWLFSRGLHRSRSLCPPGLWRRRHDLWDAAMLALSPAGGGPVTLLHQDPHPGNWLRDPAGRVGLYDWQCVAQGGWALDISYALCTGLAPDDRRRWQRDLLARYLTQLRHQGVEDPPGRPEAEQRYRQQALHVLLFSLPVKGLPSWLPQVQPPLYADLVIGRALEAIDDLGSLAALDA